MSSCRRVELKLSPQEAQDPLLVNQLAIEAAGWNDKDVTAVPVRRSLDARKGQPKVVIACDVWRGPPPLTDPPFTDRIPTTLKDQVLVVGAGPAGYFCALELLLLGIRPIVLERGKDTRSRRYDLKAIMQHGLVNPHSNYGFGEGGAGTYSDGKLYTRSSNRKTIRRALSMLVEHGAKPSILIDTHPHIGSNKLPAIVENLRASIEKHGGQVHFNQHVTDFIGDPDHLQGVRTASGDTFKANAIVLATGHSARDIFQLLHKRGLKLEAKTFAVGVRVEHPQALIDEAQYRKNPRGNDLPAASYRLAHHDVYSFCMCPGGLMIPAATAPGEIVVNGMSLARRDSRWANSGIVTTVTADDTARLLPDHGVLAGLELQRSIESLAFAANEDHSQKAPAQRLKDFLKQRVSPDLPRVSYVPGVVSVDLNRIFPPRLCQALIRGFQAFESSIKGFTSHEAVIVGVETRTSSPVRIPRQPATLTHPQVDNLYPCGEGAGYAGGIISAALDGQRVAQAVAQRLIGSSLSH